MIFDAILYLFYGAITFLTAPLLLLGDVSLDSNLTTSITTASSYYHSVNSILPMDTMLAILGISLTIELAYATYKLIMWVIKKIPTIN
jgi:HD-like signal output (HDOD) protein